jgi:hypothetical protein
LGILLLGLGAGLGLSAVLELDELSCISSFFLSIITESASDSDSVLGIVRGTTLGGVTRLAGAEVVKRGILEAVAGGDLGDCG